MEVKEIMVLHECNPIGIDQTPCFSWKIVSDKKNVFQTAYRICVSDSRGITVWDSNSDRQYME